MYAVPVGLLRTHFLKRKPAIRQRAFLDWCRYLQVGVASGFILECLRPPISSSSDRSICADLARHEFWAISPIFGDLGRIGDPAWQ